MTAARISDWLIDWVAATTGTEASSVDPDAPMQNLGLSSRDVVVLSGELENLLGITLDATVAYEHPTINALAGFVTSPAAREKKPGSRRKETAPVTGGGDHTGPGVHDIAVVGISARFPGGEDVDSLWDLLVAGRSGVGELPIGRWSEYINDAVMAGKMAETNTTGGYLADIGSFDPGFFGLSPLEAANMDPQQRIVLELAWEALDHARIPASDLKGTNVGVFIGSTNNDYGMLIAADPAEAHPYALTGTASSVIANRVSYFFDFTGPSISVDTACSSSLVAIHQAVRALRSGDCDAALAGGVNILASPFISTAFGELGVISPTGAIHAFSDDADGFVRGDGAGLVVLKRVDDAIAAGDNILAVIKGSAVNSDGRSNGITAPKPEAQVDVLQRAYRDAGVDAATVDYVEAHGTGTLLGDPIEATALAEVLGKDRDIASPLLLGSAKTNFGHTESAAGAAGLIKVVLAMVHGVIPPSLNYTSPNRHIDFDAGHLEVVEDPREWPAYSGVPTAGISGFGFGGTNAHLVVTAFDQDTYGPAAEPVQAQLGDGGPVLLPVSGHLPSRRKDTAGQLAGWLEDRAQAGTGTDLVALSRSLVRKNHGRSAAIVEAHTTEEAVQRLKYVADGKRAQGIHVQDAPSAQGPVFVYSGFGSQHRTMAKDLMHTSALFADRLRELDDIIVFESGWSLIDLIEDDSKTYDTETAQVAITAIQIALTDLLASFGAKPAAVTAMSMGEIAAAYACGGLSATDAMRVACARSRLMGEGEQSLPEDQLGAMAVVEFSVDELDHFIDNNPEFSGIEPAVYAGPGMTTVGGPRDAVITLVELLEKEGKFSRLLNVKGAGHTSAVDPLLGELAAETSDIDARPITIPLYSSVDKATVYQPGEVVHDSDYWTRCTRGRVWFLDAVEKVFAAGHDMLIEICPNPVAILGMMNTAFSVGKGDAQLLYTLKRKENPAESLKNLLAKMWVAGYPVDLRGIDGDGDITDAPISPWVKQRYWTAARPSSTTTPPLPGRRVSLPDGSVAFSTLAELAPSTAAILEKAAEAVNPKATVTAVEEHSTLPASGEITTIAKKTVGGTTIAMYRVMGETFTLIAEAFAGVIPQGKVLDPGLENKGTRASEEETGLPEVESRLWEPDSGETVEERLRAIVSESMGYDVEDLPGELPLIDLGLDSLMGMRIKNRVENDFQIPALQVQALRDASVADVVRIVEGLVAKRLAGDDTDATDPAADSPAHTPSDTPATGDVGGDTPQGVGVAPRDASERLVFATWAAITGKAPAGITSAVETIDDDTAAAIATRLTERSGATITAADVLAANTLEPLSDMVRDCLETEVDGNIRVLRERKDGSTKPAVFMFHPAGGSSVVYQPLMRRLPEDVPVYGVERREGTLSERAEAYIDEIRQYAHGHDVILGGWSFGGALAYEVAHQLVGSDINVPLIALLDTVQPSEPIPDTPEETKARWERYAAFAKKTYNLDFPVPYELLESAGEDALLDMMGTFLATTDASQHGLSAGVLEHQRASFVDNRILNHLDMTRWADVDIPVILFRAERMHDGAIELEPNYAHIDRDGGWATIVRDLSIVQLHGDHLAVVDEPEIATVGAHLTKAIDELG